MVKKLNKHVSGKTIDAAIELRQLIGPQDKLCHLFNITPQGLSRRETDAINNGTGITKEHCGALIPAARKMILRIYDLMTIICDNEGIPKGDAIALDGDECEACRLGGKGGEK